MTWIHASFSARDTSIRLQRKPRRTGLLSTLRWRPSITRFFRVAIHVTELHARKLNGHSLAQSLVMHLCCCVFRCIGERISELTLDLSRSLGSVFDEPLDGRLERVGG